MKENNKTLNVLLFALFLMGGAVSVNPAAAFERVNFVGFVGNNLEEPVDVRALTGVGLFILEQKAGQVSIFSADGKFKESFGVAEGLKLPQALDIDQEGRVVVADTGNHRIVAFNQAGKYLFHFGRSGSQPGQFKNPVSVASDHFGFIFVADRDNRRVQVFTPNGVFYHMFFTESSPLALALDAQRNVYVLMPDLEKIVKYTPQGKRLDEITCRMNGRNYLRAAADIAVDRKGDIILVERDEQSVKKFDQKGNILASFGSYGIGRGQFADAASVTVDAQANVYVADTANKRVQILKMEENTKPDIPRAEPSPLVLDYESSIPSEKGITDLFFLPGKGFYSLSKTNNQVLVKGRIDVVFGKTGPGPGELLNPLCMDVTLNGLIYVADTDNNRIQIFNPDGSLNYQFGTKGGRHGQFFSPQGIAVNSKGIIYVADTRNNRLQMFNQDGIFLSSFGSPFKQKNSVAGVRSPKSLAVDSHDNVFVVDYENHKVKLYSENGEYLGSIGSRGENHGQFNDIADIAVDENDNLYVADRGNHRLQVFDREGQFLLSFGTEGEGQGYFREISSVAVAENKIYVGDAAREYTQVFWYRPHIPSGKSSDDQRIYSSQTASVPADFTGNEVEKYNAAKTLALKKAREDLVKNFGLDEEKAAGAMTIESVSSLNNGQVKVTVSISTEAVKAEPLNKMEKRF